MVIIRTIMGFAAVAFFGIVYIPVFLVLGLLKLVGLGRFSRYLMFNKFLRLGGRVIAICAGCTIRSIDRDATKTLSQRNEGICFVSNHTGYFDIIIILATLGFPFGFVAKKEILFVPLVNLWVIFLGGFFLDRSNPRSAVKTITRGSKKIKNGHSILIFPEGTRSRGRGLLPFKSGSFEMAVAANAPIVPIAITGGYEVLEQTGLAQKVTAYISFGKPIETSTIEGDHKRKILSDMAHEAIAEMLKGHGDPVQ